jgi:hypothetical protein
LFLKQSKIFENLEEELRTLSLFKKERERERERGREKEICA